MLIPPVTESQTTAAPTGTDRFDYYVAGSLIGLLILIEVLINPVGDFPLNDDWAYGLPVKWLVEEGRLRFTEQYVALFTQVMWGSLFVSLAGFSYTVLRISTIVLAAVGLVATYLAGREVGLTRAGAAGVAGLLAINPVFVSLANSFMTDVPFVSLMMVSLFFLVRGLKHHHRACLWAGWVTVLAASLIRQVGLALPVGLVVAAAIKDGIGRRWLVRFVVPATIVLLTVMLAYPQFLKATSALPPNYLGSTDNVKMVLGHLAHLRLGAAKPIIKGVAYGLMHLGLWMLPFLVLTFPRWSGGETHRARFAVVGALGGIATVATAGLWCCGMLMPLGPGGSILADFGLGVYDLAGQRSGAPSWFWIAITWASAFGAASIVLASVQVGGRALATIRSGQARQSLWLATFLLVSLVLYYSPFCISYHAWFDRYLLPAMALLVLLLAAEPLGAIRVPQPVPVTSTLISTVLALLYLGFAVAATHDSLAWNRQRWAATASLIARGATSPDDIQGGFAFNRYHAWRDLPAGTRVDESELSWADSKEHARYLISFSGQRGFREVRRFPINRWLPYSPDQILILERTETVSSAPGSLLRSNDGTPPGPDTPGPSS
jgi:hypothetical protein